jgi:hypothetical protein
MSGTMPLLPLHAFTAWTGKTLAFTFYTISERKEKKKNSNGNTCKPNYLRRREEISVAEHHLKKARGMGGGRALKLPY